MKPDGREGGLVRDGGGRRVLLVDDHENLLTTLGDCLLFEGFEVIRAISGEAALQRVAETAPDVVVLDISMPGIGGWGFLDAIRGTNGRPRFPVILLTACADAAERAERAGAAAVLSKPCTQCEVVRRIKETLDGDERRPVRRKTVLLAEDDPGLSERVREALSEAGFDVLCAKTGADAMEAAASARPAVLLIKEALPVLRGSVVASLLRRMPDTRDVASVLYDDTRSIGGRRRGDPRIPDGLARFVPGNDVNRLVRAVRELVEGP